MSFHMRESPGERDDSPQEERRNISCAGRVRHPAERRPLSKMNAILSRLTTRSDALTLARADSRSPIVTVEAGRSAEGPRASATEPEPPLLLERNMQALYQ
ncbi:hypothetical protein NDU88_005744 [Pleurodeles waltl]|uniref:Uncharacterized protein n=1 Tax=Pleurodeles waltl TaxID=8319 RepID=A0AAV7RKI6_PLEWA|nr:hypothetical protein NDU88_005744 [Pleurodeles waltl]